MRASPSPGTPNERPGSTTAAPSPALFPAQPPAVLALADGTIFRGRAIGAAGHATGEVVFNTAMTGYQEILTDPSYAGQIVTLTYPHIGNVGVNRRGRRIATTVRRRASSSATCRASRRAGGATDDLSAPICATANVVGIADIDTRKLTRILRERGAQNGCIVAAAGLDDEADTDAAVARARAAPSMAGLDLAKVVSLHGAPTSGPSGTWALGERLSRRRASRASMSSRTTTASSTTSCACSRSAGASSRSCRRRRPARDVLALEPDGVFLSQRPRRSRAVRLRDRARSASSSTRGMPTFGICLGHQLLGLASGARTLKMKFGHHGANHPVLDKDTGQVLITSQNHGFAVDPASLPANVRVTHVSLFDGSLQGIARTDRPAFSFQGHPEASPGPHDLGYLFDRFVKIMEQHRQKA